MARRLRACAVLALLVCAGASPSVFEATSEFQEIQEGQQVPAGLHYRINLETGKKEAKLIDPNQKDEDATKATAYGSMAVAPVSTADAATPAPDAAAAAAAAAAAEKQLQADALAFARAARAKTRAASASAASASASTSAASSDTASASAPDSASAGSGSKAQYEMMENVFQALPGPDGDAARKVLKTKSTVTPEQYKRALGLLWQKRQRSVADAGAHLRDEAREIHLLTKTLNDKNATVAAKEDALDQMQILVMQIDNARDFVTLGGLDTCVALLQDHEDTIEHIALAPLAAWVIGTAAQNDNVVQDASAKAGAIEALLAILKRSEMFNACEEADVCTASTMVAKDLYALSALTRNNAGSLKALMDADGLALIATTAAAESRPGGSTGGSACKVRVKSIAFMADLLASTETDRRQGSYDVQSAGAAHVDDTEVIDALGSPEWCNLVIGSLPLCDSPVWQEKVLHGMAQLKAKSMCLSELSSASTRSHLEAIKMPIDDPDDEFQKELHALAVALLQ